MKKDKNISKELKEFAPELSKIKKDHLEDLPTNYFEALPEKIFDRIRKEEATVPAWQTWMAAIFQPKLKVVYAIAAVVVFGLFLTTDRGENSESLEIQFADLSEQDLSNYVLANLEDFEGDWFATNVNLSESDDVLILDSDYESIEEYLLEEMDDLEYDGIIL